jgi:hypothetical protein
VQSPTDEEPAQDERAEGAVRQVRKDRAGQPVEVHGKAEGEAHVDRLAQHVQRHLRGGQAQVLHPRGCRGVALQLDS